MLNAEDPPAVTIITIVIILALYFIPSAYAIWRKHPQTVPIVALNLLGGWTFLLWVAAMIWALYNPAPATKS